MTLTRFNILIIALLLFQLYIMFMVFNDLALSSLPNFFLYFFFGFTEATFIDAALIGGYLYLVNRRINTRKEGGALAVVTMLLVVVVYIMHLILYMGSRKPSPLNYILAVKGAAILVYAVFTLVKFFEDWRKRPVDMQ